MFYNNVISILLILIAVINAAFQFIDYSKLNKRLRITLAIILLILAGTGTYLQIEVEEPDVFPVSGNLNEDNLVTVKNRSSWRVISYYSTDPNDYPIKTGIKYVAPFIPDSSGEFYFQSEMIGGKKSGIKILYITKYGNVSEPEVIGGDENRLQEKKSNMISDKYSPYGILPEDFVCGWGDSDGGRQSYTIEQVNNGVLRDLIILNSIKDNPFVGDERFFVQGRLSGSDDYWSTSHIIAELNQEYTIRIYIHNNSRLGRDAVAEDVACKVTIPKGAGRSIGINGAVRASNSIPREVWDGVYFTNQDMFRIEYVEGSARLDCKGHASGMLSDKLVNGGVYIGYDKLDGQLPGCFGFSGFVTFKIRIVPA